MLIKTYNSYLIFMAFPFKVNAADSLPLTIESYLDKRIDVYARHASIVNSSGTGKFHMVDEVATKIIMFLCVFAALGLKVHFYAFSYIYVYSLIPKRVSTS
ncbi:hypothetical protein B0F90DRAFT_365059 [Multifurca ochricompacta]|uniref:Uncharacterized protein n=1 Tax=Multifurca ochricompacta TaxID=376703 RepID=A0AAD4LUZ7_9AGAM|nr:hypothetical protein B0F90DRAFT_365059 [Multifurca ochricompacta]